MANINRFEDLHSWQKARELADLLYRFTGQGAFAKDSEVQSQLYLALDQNYITQDELKKAYDLATEVKRLINGMIGYLRKHP